MKNLLRLISAMLFLIALTGCGLFQADKPIVIIESPPSGSQFHEGEEISVQSASTDKKAIVRVELVVDGNVADVDPSPTAQGQPHFTLVQQWKATQGQHTLLVRAYNAAGQMSDPAGVNVTVLPAIAQSSAPQQQQPTATFTPTPTPTPTATPTTAPGQPPAPPPPPACTNNSAFVADVTIPDGTSVPPGGAFTKTWRFSNNGTCTWGAGYQFVFVAGEAMTANTTVQVPQTAPGATADFSVAMTASSTPGTHVGKWQLRTASTLFGQIGNVTISVPAPPPPPPPAGCSGAPNIASFTSDKTTSTLATNVTLSWGAVTNADSVEIDNGIGGVATPGSTSVYVTSTKTWTMTAKCGANAVSKQVTVKITGLGSIGVIGINPALLAALALHVTNTSLTAFPNPGFCLSGNKQSVAFIGKITVNNPGTLKYQWEFSDGTNGGSQQITYGAAGEQSVSISHTFSSSGWALLNFISPDDPNSAKVFFTKDCLNFGFPFP